ncbi:hypothetical protein WJX72_003440 [[Myrmecia] bisecta]|uniref:Chloride channel protein n=1 Tax=[Myrmecia] bisecta TaxID=41462 RepID=A0AAW1P5N0_9CHLO
MKQQHSHLRVPLVPLPESSVSDFDGGPEHGTHFTSFGLNHSNGEGASTSYLSDSNEEEHLLPSRNPFKSLFQRGHDVEGAGVNHHYTREERERLNDVESIDYLPPNSAVYRKWLAGQPHGRIWDRWFMMGSIGVSVGLIGYLLYTLIELFANVKYVTVRWLLAHTNLFVAWLFNMVYSLALVFASTWAVVMWAPQAAGAGVAEVMAYLNGCSLPKVFNIRTLGVKFISCATAVGSGLPVGPEGPMIHIGAMIGAALSQGHSTTLGCSTGLFKRFQNPKDKRDFVTAGTAVGVAAAFGAPIGGLLFAFEELASFFSQSLGWQIFFACMLAVLSADTFRSAQRSITKGHFGYFDGDASTVFFEVQTQLKNHVAAMAPAIVIGIACGLLGIMFTFINLKVARIREATTKGSKVWRMAEPCLLMAIFVTLGMLLPLAFPCTPTLCTIKQGETMPDCPEGASSHIKRIVEESVELYTCSANAEQTDLPPDSSSGSGPKSYNELATLMSVTGEDAIRHLLSRGTHREFGYGAIIVMLIFYFAGAVWAAGSAIASGLFVPMLLIGACVGRLVGLIVVDFAARGGHGSPNAPPGVFLPPSPWAWIDPGAFALIGAGAFMGGVTRLTISLAVIMMEVSNDVRMLLPILVAILVAKWVADALTHSLYHGLLEVKCVPFLPSEPACKRSLDLMAAHHVMSSPVCTLRERMVLRDVREVLRDTRHNGFPVVRDTPQGQVFVGLVVRDHLMVLLRRALSLGTTRDLDVKYEDLNRKFVSAAARNLVTDQQLAALQGRNHGGVSDSSNPVFDEVLDLTSYINSSAATVQEVFSLERTYMVFKTLGARHLTVVDQHNHVKGIITRKDLLGYRLDYACERQHVSSIVTLDRPYDSSASQFDLDGEEAAPMADNEE